MLFRSLFASRLKYWENGGEKRRKATRFMISPKRVELWKTIARIYLGEIDIGVPLYFVKYDSWRDSIDYRKKICTDLVLSFSDAELNYVPDYAYGSSFDGFLYQNRGHVMKTQNRWEYYKNDERYLSFFDEEIRDLSKRIFDFCPL